MTVNECLQAGKLKDAIGAAVAAVKAAPMSIPARSQLCELLCFNGDLSRVDTHLDTIAQQEPKILMGVSLFRHLVRAEEARQQFFNQGRVPELFGPASAEIRLRLEASIRVREGKLHEAASMLEEAEAQRVHLRGSCNGQAFDDLRDLDDLLGSVLELLTANGKYYWVPLDQVESLTFRPAEHMRDLLWRKTEMAMRNGVTADVYVPVLYAGTHASDDERMRLGRSTDWLGGDASPVRGLGQRTFLVGESDTPILKIETIKFAE